MKLKKMLTSIAVIGVLTFSLAHADEKWKSSMMQEHHALIDDTLMLLKDMIGTMKEISPTEEIKMKTDDYNRRVDELINKHGVMKEQKRDKKMMRKDGGYE